MDDGSRGDYQSLMLPVLLASSRGDDVDLFLLVDARKEVAWFVENKLD